MDVRIGSFQENSIPGVIISAVVPRLGRKALDRFAARLRLRLFKPLSAGNNPVCCRSACFDNADCPRNMPPRRGVDENYVNFRAFTASRSWAVCGVDLLHIHFAVPGTSFAAHRQQNIASLKGGATRWCRPFGHIIGSFHLRFDASPWNGTKITTHHFQKYRRPMTATMPRVE